MTTHRQIFSDYRLSTNPHTLTIATDPPTTATPEPLTAALLSTGALALIAFAAIRRRMVTT